MSAAGLLSSWRARWHKPGAADLQVPYRTGRTAWLIDRLARSRVWRLGLTAPASVLLGLALMAFGIGAPLTLNGQILLSALLLGFVALVCRVDNAGLRLTLAYLSALCSWRYFYWRLDDTLPSDGGGLMLSLLLWFLEVLAWVVIAFDEASPVWLLQASPQRRAGRLLQWARQTLPELARRLRFYQPLATLILIVLPGLCLVVARWPLQSTMTALLAFVLPHAVLLRLARMPLDGGRIPLVPLVHEWLLEAALIWRTALSFAVTLVRNAGAATIRRSAGRLPNPALPPRLWLREGLVLALQCAAVATWFHRHADPLRATTDVEWLLLAACAVHALCALARLAQHKERAQVELELGRRARQPVLLALGASHVLRGETDNFPQTPLRVRWDPARARTSGRRPEPGDRVGFSVFYREVEASFSAVIDTVDDAGLVLRVTLDDLESYQAFGAAVFSRGSDWPAWLPAKNADRILPAGLHRLYDALETFIYDFFVVRKGPQALWQRLQFWRGPQRSGSGR